VKVGPYTLSTEPRKEGGQAFVYFSTDPDSGERVAIKIARPTEWSRLRMKKEIKAQQALDHPNVLPILAHDEGYGWYAAVRANGSLDDFGPFPAARRSYLRVGLMGVASAVGHAHQEGYVHRDLSPGNVLVFPGGWAVSDWGFVREPRTVGVVRMTQPLERFGTLDFMAPEMMLDPSKAGPPADIFSIGCLASWGTGLDRGEAGPEDDPSTAWWRMLIDGATRYEPSARWTMQDVETHLRSTPPLSAAPAAARLEAVQPISGDSQVVRIADYRRERAYEPCPHCASTAGGDATDRCLGCHAMFGH
jgi:serine/threonine protein kinase